MGTHLQYIILIGLLLPIVYCPGPMTMFCMSSGISVGKKKTVLVILGGSTAYFIQMLITFCSIDLIQRYDFLITSIRMLGAAYLAYLGIRYFKVKNVLEMKKNLAKTHKKLFLSGFLIAISNPKSMLVYLSIFPRFVNQNEPVLLQYVCIGFLFLVVQSMSAMTYTFVGDRLFQWTQTKNNQRIFRIVVGSLLIAASILLMQM